MVKAHVVNARADLLSSKVKAEVFRLPFGVRDEWLHLRELARQSGLAVGTVRQELNRRALTVEASSTHGGSRLKRALPASHPPRRPADDQAAQRREGST